MAWKAKARWGAMALTERMAWRENMIVVEIRWARGEEIEAEEG